MINSIFYDAPKGNGTIYIKIILILGRYTIFIQSNRFSQIKLIMLGGKQKMLIEEPPHLLKTLTIICIEQESLSFVNRAVSMSYGIFIQREVIL